MRVLLPAGPCHSQKYAPVYREVREEGGAEKASGPPLGLPCHANEFYCSGSSNRVPCGASVTAPGREGDRETTSVSLTTKVVLFLLRPWSRALVWGVHLSLPSAMAGKGRRGCVT